MTQANDNDGMCYWRCPNCGQLHFSDVPPDMCAFCRDFTTWQLIAGNQPEAGASLADTWEYPASEDADDHPPRPPHQRRLFD